MEKTGYIEIRITGKKGNLDLSPDNYDIREVIEVLEQVEGLIVPGDKKDRFPISYQLESGSVKHIFKTTLQYIIGFNAVVGQVSKDQSVDFLDLPTAKAFEAFQNKAFKKNYVFEIKTSLDNTNVIKIDKTTHFCRTEAVWVEAEFYFYGKITSMGGKEKSNIHIATDDMGLLTIQTEKEYLAKLENNLLYKNYGVRAVGKQHAETGEIDRNSLHLLEFINYQPTYDEAYLKALRSKAKDNWSDSIDPDKWLREIRGGYDA